MELLCDLLFELSNEDRLRILLELREKPMKLSQISKSLDYTIQETSRNARAPKYIAIYEFDRPGVTDSEAWKKAVELTPVPKDLVITNFSREIQQLIYP